MGEPEIYGVVIPMAEEMSALRSSGLASREYVAYGFPIVEIDRGAKRLVVIESGIGKINAAAASALAIARWQVSALFIVGLAGAMKEDLTLGDVVVASAAATHDFDLRPLVRDRGRLPGRDSALYPASQELLTVATNASREVLASNVTTLGVKLISGLVVSGDALVSDGNLKSEILKSFPEAACVDMETSAIAQIAERAGIGWGAIRVISDQADDTFEAASVLDFAVKEASKLLASVLLTIVG